MHKVKKNFAKVKLWKQRIIKIILSKNLALVVLLVLLNIRLQAQIQRIDSILEFSAQEKQFSGSVIIAKNGDIIFETTKGYSDLQKETPIDDKTAFSIASVGKIFTATLIMKLVESGKLNLNSPIDNYLPGLSIPNGDKISIHHLLSHTSGLGNYMSSPLYEKIRENEVRIDDIIPLITSQPLIFPEPGQRHEYSNSGYIILGKIIETTMEKSYSEVLSELILEPLFMSSTKLTFDGKDFNEMAIGYRKSNPDSEWESTMKLLPAPLSDGGIFTTCKDILAFDRALFSGKILEKETLELMMECHSEGVQPGVGKMTYGYGLMINNFSGQTKSVGHNGGSPGYNTEYRHYFIDQNTQYTVILFSNHERVIRPIFYQIQDMILNKKI